MDRRRKIIPEKIQQRITKFFVTNLPERCSGSDLADHVRQFGKIFDLYIARKRDKGGNRFGFVSMLDVKDKEEILKNLRNIRIGEFRLWFNVARFVLEDGEIQNKKAQSNINYKKQQGGEAHWVGKASVFEKGERSFKEMLVSKSVIIDSGVNAFTELYGRALVARMIDLDALKNVKVILNEICPALGKVQYLGGLDVLLTFEDAETAVAVREAARSIVGRFSRISIWEGQTFGFERLAWLKVQGIPLHLSTNEVINIVGGVFGKIVHKANRSNAEHDLSYEYVGVLLGDGKRVSEEVILQWKDRKFRVWVMEELGDWLPDFIDEKTTPDAVNTEESDEEEPKKHEEQNMETNNCINDNDYYDCVNQSSPINAEQSAQLNDSFSKIDDREVVFVPAINFPFEQFFRDNNEGQMSRNKVNKRKKFKKGSGLGRPSNSYSSSQESLKVVKRPKKSDPFGLNNLLGLNDEDESNTVDEEVVLSDKEQEDFDLNCHPNSLPPENINPLDDRRADTEVEKNNESHTQEANSRGDELHPTVEIEATKEMGEKLGVHL